MVRFPTAARAPKRPAVDPLHHGRLLLRRLLDENLALRRELDELRLLRRLAHQDALTGLPNRRLFEQRLHEELSRALRAGTTCGTLLVVDVNDLKLVNDRHGHAVGDDVLREVADVLRGALREADVCCRTGGDEFMILLPETNAQGAPQVMARLRAAVIRAGARRNLPVSISVGCATWPMDGRTAAAVIEHADGAMYREKRRLHGRARRKPPRPEAGRKLALVKP
jgi:diguanylate cyclase (GGDEF)-like protein